MEALTVGLRRGADSIYDMLKAVEKGIEITEHPPAPQEDRRAQRDVWTREDDA